MLRIQHTTSRSTTFTWSNYTAEDISSQDLKALLDGMPGLETFEGSPLATCAEQDQSGKKRKREECGKAKREKELQPMKKRKETPKQGLSKLMALARYSSRRLKLEVSLPSRSDTNDSNDRTKHGPPQQLPPPSVTFEPAKSQAKSSVTLPPIAMYSHRRPEEENLFKALSALPPYSAWKATQQRYQPDFFLNTKPYFTSYENDRIPAHNTHNTLCLPDNSYNNHNNEKIAKVKSEQRQVCVRASRKYTRRVNCVHNNHHNNCRPQGCLLWWTSSYGTHIEY